jgi:hypothetical protein
MSQWAIIFFTASQLFKRIHHLIFSLFCLGRIVLLFAMAVFLTLFIADENVFAGKLFQSPVDTSPPPPAEAPPADPPPPEAPPAEAPPVEPPPVEPAVEIEAPVSPIPPGSPALPSGSEPPPLAQPTLLPSRSNQEDRSIDGERAEEDSPNFILDQVELVDSIVVTGAYFWLCCGVALFLLIPLIFLLLQIRGHLKLQREENL